MSSPFLLEDDFLPAYESFHSFQKKAQEDFGIAVSRGQDIAFPFFFRITLDFEESYFYAKKILLTLLWMVGGDKITLLAKEGSSFASYFHHRASLDPEIQTSCKAMEEILSSPLSWEISPELPEKKERQASFGSSFSGSRIGLDLGGSDRKVTAMVDGKVVYSNETLWSPKGEKDYHYHVEGIKQSLLEAKSHLQKVDAVGVSIAGTCLDNNLIFPALFASVPESDKIGPVKNLFKDLIPELFPNVPFQIENDGDVSAIGASVMFGMDNVLGLALGTSFAAGYAEKGYLLSWINELSKAPINFSPSARKHYIFGIDGAASEYLSQKGIVLLLEKVGFPLSGTLPEKLLQIQEEMKRGNPIVEKAYRDMGIYLGSSLAYFSLFYPVKNVLLLGRVLTGEGGQILMESAQEYLNSKNVEIRLGSADENFKRLGQSYVAACLPKVG